MSASSSSESDRAAIVRERGERAQRLNAWRKRSPFNAWWIDWSTLRRSIESLAAHARGRLLDIGCSEAPYRHLFAPRVEAYIGMEYPPSILDKRPDLWDFLHVARRSIEFFGDGCALPLADRTFDTVLATEVLEHLPEPARLVDEAARVLRPGGKLLLTVPFTQPLHELPGDYYRFAPASLEHLVRSAGLVPEEITPRGNFASALGAMLSQFLLRSLCARERLPDGSVWVSRWRSTLLMPVIALVQVTFHLASKLTRDTTVCLGYTVVAHKPSE